MSLALSRQDLTIDPIARASTIPGQWYTDPAMLDLENDKVFGGSWLLVGRTGQLAEPGAYFTCEIGSEPLVVVRGQDGTVRAFSNVCRHRGGPVARGEGTLRTFHCSYHGWTYNLDGSLRLAPELGDIEEFDKSKMSLPAARVEIAGPLVFVNLDHKAPPLARYLGDFPDYLQRYDADRLRFVVQKRYEVAANWKILLDNFLECYHCPLLHRTTVAANVDLANYVVESHDWYSRHYFGSVSPDKLAAASKAGVRAAAAEQTVRHTYCFFPNYAINLLPGWLITFRVLPVSVDRSIVLRDFFCEDADRPIEVLEKEGAMAYYAKVFAEDIEMVELVQKQLRSKSYTRGRYSLRHEQGVYHFHSLLRRALADG